MGLPWAAHEMSMGYAWTARVLSGRRSMNWPWTAHALTANGLPMGCPRDAHEMPSGCPSDAHGMRMNCAWTAREMPM